jgi:hypothetical protein
MNERFTTLDQVVKDICEIGGDDYDHKSYGKVLKVCVNTLRGFNLYSSTPYVKTEEFEVLPNNTVLLPKNALDVVRVGKNDRCGEIEEIFYSKDLSMDAKNIEEHCECSGKVQVIETIETGTGETLCDYIVEGIDLGSGDNIEYETIIIFAETFEMQNGWVGDGIQNCCVLQNITSGVITNIVEIKALELNNASSVSSGIYTISGSQIATMVYDKLSILALPNYTIVLDNNILTITTNNDWLYFGLSNRSTSSYSKYPTGEFYFTWTTNGDIASDIFVDNYKYFLILPFKEPLYSFEVNINGEWEDETDNVSENGTWSLSNTTNIVTEWRYRDSEGNPGEPTPIVGVCRVDLQRQEVSKWVDNNIECDTNGRCKSCGNFVPTYTTAWYGGWYSSAPIYSRQLAQNNLNLPNSGQAYYEQYTARPYPAKWGFYNLDLAKGVMRLTHNFEHDEKVVIIYSTDMVEIEGAKVVAVEWFDMLLYRCKELIWNRNSVDGTRQRQLYEREYTRIKKIYNKTTHEEWRRAIMKVKYSGVKR